MHQGGGKRVTRRGDGPELAVDVPAGSITLVPAGTEYRWATEGPVAFAHLYLDPVVVDRVVQDRFDRDPQSVRLNSEVGFVSPCIQALFECMLGQLARPGFASRIALDALQQAFVVQLLGECSTLTEGTAPARHSLAPRRLRRVLDFIEANLADEIELDDLAIVAGSSRFHFSRAFRDATGFPPYRYLVQRRIHAAKEFLLESQLPISAISEQCGFKSSAQFGVMFKQLLGTSPGRFRREN